MWKVVIIDDDPNLLEGMRYAIPWKELNAEWAGEAIDGKEGMELILQAKPDIIISDIDMPVMNGLEMLEALRREQYEGKFIILSGYSDFEYARQALRLSVDDYLSKPITIDSLKKVLERVIGNLEQERLKEQEAQEHEQRLQDFEPYVMKEWLKSLLIGDANKQVVQSDLIQAKVERWEKQVHVVLCMELEMSDGLKNWYAFGRNLMRFAIQNVVREIMDAYGAEYEYIEMNSRLYALLIHLDADGESKHLMESITRQSSRQIETCLRDHVKLVMATGIGSIQQDWRQLGESFERACHTLKGETLGQNGPIQGQEISSVRFFHQLAEAVRNVQEEHGNRLIAEYTAGLKAAEPFHKQDVKLFVSELWIIMNYTLYDIGIELKSIYPAFEPVSEPDDEHTAVSLQRWLEEMVRTIIHSTHMNENVRHQKIVEFITQFTHEHYMEDITLGMIAEKVQVSKNYLGQIFKNVMNETFNNYVTRIRMERAKGMLLEGNLYIYEVAEKVGYNSISYFSTQFKKYTGYNPTDLIK
jgi:two-component system response regulator YesN